MDKKLLNKLKSYVDNEINNPAYKDKIYYIFNEYISLKRKNYEKTYDKEMINSILFHCVDEFISRLSKLIKCKNTLIKFIYFIKENKYKFNESFLLGEDKELYNLINSNDFDIEQYVLKDDHLDVFTFFNKIYNLAVRFGLPEKKHVTNDNLAFVDDKVPNAIKEGIKAVE